MKIQITLRESMGIEEKQCNNDKLMHKSKLLCM